MPFPRYREFRDRPTGLMVFSAVAKQALETSVIISTACERAR